MKKILSLLLIVCFTASTFPADPPPRKQTTVAMACFVVVIGGIVAVGLWKLCKCIPNPPKPNDPPPPPPTNPPPIINPTNPPPVVTNKPPWWKRPFSSLQVQTNAVKQFDIAHLNYRDGTNLYHTMLTARLESSSDAQSWQPACTITGWISPSSATWAYYTNGVPAVVTYSSPLAESQTNFVPLEIGTGTEPQKMFRLVSVE